MSISLLMAQQAPSGVDVVSRGKALSRAENDSLSAQDALFEASLSKVDVTRSKTITIHPDGTREELIGAEGFKEDVSDQPVTPLKTGPKTVERGAGSVQGNQAHIASLGRVAGIEPSFEDVLKGLDKETSPPQKVSSPEDIRKDLEAKLGKKDSVVLIVSDRKKVRVMELKRNASIPSVRQPTGSSFKTP